MTLEEKLKAKVKESLTTEFSQSGETVTMSYQKVVLLSDALAICQQEIDEERNIGAKLMAERILDELKNPSDGKFGSDTANAIIDYHTQEIDEAKPKWISVKDRLPEKGQQVLAYNPTDKEEPFWVDYLFLNANKELSWDMGMNEVTHWMTLPESPKESE